MTIKFTGKAPTITRMVTGMYTFDHAFATREGEIGLPIKTIFEIAGNKGVGKSTFAYSIAAMIAKDQGTNIVLGDIEEHLNASYVTSIMERTGFDGEVLNASGKKDSDILTTITQEMAKDDYSVGILDSIGAISPIAEDQGGLEDAIMGRRALLMGHFARRIIKVFRDKDKPSILLATNHLHANIGTWGKSTSGGVTLEYLTSVRIRLAVKEKQDDGSYWLEGSVSNNAFGFSGKKFYIFSLAGWGIHPGLTAVRDCVVLGLAKESKTIKIDGVSYGFFKKMIAQADDPELFQPFINLLNSKSGTEPIEFVDTESEDES